jgi:hypothetical protein
MITRYTESLDTIIRGSLGMVITTHGGGDGTDTGAVRTTVDVEDTILTDEDIA